MSDETLSDLDLLRDAAREVREREGAKKGGRFVQHAFPGGPTKKMPSAMFGPRRMHDDRLSTKPAPGPKGPPTAQLLEDAKRRRRERTEERNR